MKPLKVSVIIPVYNTENYLRDTLLCIINQTLREIEIILIDDGSTDSSLLIMKEYAAQDARIRIVEQTNQGQAAARDNGTRQARGEFVYYMDSDDILEADALEVCYERCKTDVLDFAFFDASILNKDSGIALIFSYERSHLFEKQEVLSGIEAMWRQMKGDGYTPSPCLSFIRLDYLKSLGNIWLHGIIHEDEYFTAVLYLHAKRVECVRRIFFLRRLRDNSTMTSHFSWRNINGYQTVINQLLKDTVQASKDIREIVRFFLKRMMNAVVWRGHELRFTDKIKLLAYAWFRFPYHIQIHSYVVLFLKR